MMGSHSSLLMRDASEHEMERHPPGRTINDVFRVCDDVEALVLNGLNESAELSILHRRPPLEVQAALNSIDLDALEDFRISGLAEDIKRGTETYLYHSGFGSMVSQFMQDDITSFLRLTSQPDTQYTLRLEYIDDDACRRFHKDCTDFRIISAYVGRGTQWGEADGHGGVIDVQELATFDVGLFLGERRPGRAHILHRSPPIGASDPTRFLMVLDIERASWRRSSSNGRRI